MNIADVHNAADELKTPPRWRMRNEWRGGRDILRVRFWGCMQGVQIIRSAVYTGVNEQRKDLHNAADDLKTPPRWRMRNEWRGVRDILRARFWGCMQGVQIIRSAVYTGVNEQRKDLHNAADELKTPPRWRMQ